MSTVTVKQIMSWNPCAEYTQAKIKKLFAGRQALSVLDVLELDIPDADKLWVVLREELVPANMLHELTCRCAERSLMRERKAGREPDPRSWQAIEAKRKWLRGGITDDELGMVRNAAWNAARDATWDMPWDAAVAAARAASLTTVAEDVCGAQAGMLKEMMMIDIPHS